LHRAAAEHGRRSGVSKADSFVSELRHAATPREGYHAVLRHGATLHDTLFCVLCRSAPHTSVVQGSEGGSTSDRLIREVRVEDIRRPLAKSRANDAAKVAWLMKSIAEVRLLGGLNSG
jgi:hypothetical protein